MLKNKNGTPYQLSSPNKIMMSQTLWDSKGILYNKVGKVIKFNKQLAPISKIDVILSNSMQVWCQPAIYEEIADPLYGDLKRKLKYGSKFMFEAVINQQTDFSISLSSSHEIPIDSVIFPKNYDKRWWKITECLKKDEYFILKGVISDYQPYFS